MISRKDMPFFAQKAFHGDTIPLSLPKVVGFDGITVADLTGWVIVFTVKESPIDADPGVIQKTSTSGDITITGGRATWEISANECRTLFEPGRVYIYDVEATDTIGRVLTAMVGEITILRDITQTIQAPLNLFDSLTGNFDDLVGTFDQL